MSHRSTTAPPRARRDRSGSDRTGDSDSSPGEHQGRRIRLYLRAAFREEREGRRRVAAALRAIAAELGRSGEELQ